MNENEKNKIEQLTQKVFELLEADFKTGEQSENNSSQKENGPNDYSSVHIVHTAKNISLEEIILLEKAALQREEALTELRKNEFEEGRKKLEETREMVAEASLCREAFLIAATYQASADGFVFLKNRDYSKAVDAMFKAIDTNQELHEDYGHRVEQRRIHLGRNIAKVFYLEGKKEESFKIALDLVKYTVVDSVKWPLGKGKTGQVDVIDQEMKLFVLDQLVSQLGEILVIEIPASSAILDNLKNIIEELEKSILPEYGVILSWCKSFFEIHNDNQSQFLENVILFLKSHKGTLPKTYNRLLQVLKTSLT